MNSVYVTLKNNTNLTHCIMASSKNQPPGDNQQRNITPRSYVNKQLDDYIVDTGEDRPVTPGTVPGTGTANDKNDGIHRYFACVSKSKTSDEDKEGYDKESGTTTHSTPVPALKGSPFTRTSSFEEAMINQTNIPERTNVKEVATISSLKTETEDEQCKEKEGKYKKKTPQPSPEKSYSKHHKRISKQQTVNPDAYDFTHPQRGYMVLIVNDMFYRQNERDGAEWDMIKSKEIARKLGFRILNRNKERNLKKGEMIRVLREAQAVDHSDSDCFALIISTHGLEWPNPRAQGKNDHTLICSDDEMIFTSTILDMFNETQCPTLKGKPKLFFIQACRGDQLDDGADVKVAHSRKAEDKTCGVVMGVGIVNKRPLPPAQKSVDEMDTRPLGNSETAPGDGPSASSVQSNFQTTYTVGIRKYGRAESNIPYMDDEPSSTIIPDISKRHLPVSAAMKHHLPSRSQSRPLFVPKDPVLPIQPRTKYYVHSPNNPQRVPIQQVTSETVHKIYAPQPYPIADTPSLKCGNDFLVLYAIPSGMFAWRNTRDGSWMIDYLHRVIMTYNMARQPTNLLSLLTKVSALMSKRETNTPSSPKMHQKKAISVIEHKLTKDVIFTPKVAMSEWVK